jgi:predicted small secreted protein
MRALETGSDIHMSLSNARLWERPDSHPCGKETTMGRTLIISSLLLMLAACNTVQGLGRDIQSVGKKGEEVLDDAKK